MTLEAAAPFTAASGAFSATWLLVAIPLFSALILLVGGRRTNKWGHYLGVAATAVVNQYSTVIQQPNAQARRAIFMRRTARKPAAGSSLLNPVQAIQ